MDVSFDAGTLNPKGDEGASVLDILRAQGRITNVVAEVKATQLRVSYDAPTTTGVCRLAAAAGSGVNLGTASTVTSVDDTPGGVYARQVTLSGLVTGTAYTFHIACSGGVIVTGEATTP